MQTLTVSKPKRPKLQKFATLDPELFEKNELAKLSPIKEKASREKLLPKM